MNEVTGHHDDAVARGAAMDEDSAARATLRTALDVAAMGSLAASVAHAGNNRLTVILSCLDLLHASRVEDEDLRLALDLATEAARQLATDFGRLLVGLRRQATRPGSTDLSQAVACARRIDAWLHGATLDIELALPAGLLVDMDRDALVSALLRVFLLARRSNTSAVRVVGTALDVPARTTTQPSLRKGRHCRLVFDLMSARLPAPLHAAPAEPGHVVERLDDPDFGLQLAALEACVHGVRGHVVVRDAGDADATRIELYLPGTSGDP